MSTTHSARRRNRASAKKAGASFERAQADWLAERLDDDRIDRRVRNGAKDRGDIAGARLRGERVVIECKSTATLALPAWLREAETERGNDDALIGVVMHKKRGTTDPAEQYVTMSAETFAVLLQGGVR
ncbi:hypothetical protein GCM10010915_12100 [Microbacterium faecale]|uniref:Holliday junction resolvase n=1 Tax=Microbacterium faecale TaxID=1804630 RepID=A0A916Y6L6_9MICO|nr:hypothetical protein [Microbacterium faecale]GGD33288.1 hypothetical protein GCM10010915_12100 [Microbacterium faecale]